MEYREFNGRSKIKIYNGDCMELMKDMKENEFDLAIVDPPYGIKESAHRNISRSKLAKTKMYKKEFWDYEKPSKEYFNELLKISSDQIIWGGNYFIDHLKSTRSFVVWDKVNAGTNFADCELAWTSHIKSVRMFSFMWNGMMQGNPADGKRNNGNKKTNEQRIHPTQKPVQLYKWLLQNYAKEGNTILDTHLGSGSIAIACWDLGYDLTAFEIDKEYFDKACERIDWHTRQKQLF
jgi:site-specific DNA-methyltransferase (adenine-specific)